MLFYTIYNIILIYIYIFKLHIPEEELVFALRPPLEERELDLGIIKNLFLFKKKIVHLFKTYIFTYLILYNKLLKIL